MTIEDLTEIGDRIKLKVPTGIHPKITEILLQFNTMHSLFNSMGTKLITQPLRTLLASLESNSMNPVLFMKNLQNQLTWCTVISDAVKSGMDIEPYAEDSKLKDLQNIYLQQVSAGKKVTLQEVIRKAENAKQDLINHPAKSSTTKFCKDITASNIICTLSEILDDIEQYIGLIIPNGTELLKTDNFEEILQFDFSPNGIWAQKAVSSGMTNPVNLNNFISDLQSEIKRNIGIYQLFKPLLKEAHTIVSLMPILLTMLYEDKPGLEKIREDCNNILNEFSLGADLERFTISLKEKIGKKRSIEELTVNYEAIKKNFKKIKEALTHNVLSYLRQLKVRTVIDDALFKDAQEIGLDFTGLNTQFGLTEIPRDFHEIKIEMTRRFTSLINDYYAITSKRLTEENGVSYFPNLKTIDELMKEVQKTVEHNFPMIPTAINPIFGGGLCLVIEVIDNLIRYFEPLKIKNMNQILGDESGAKQFYDGLAKYYEQFGMSYQKFSEIMMVGLKLAIADQYIAVQFSLHGGDTAQHAAGYADWFQKSLKNVQRLVGMKTLSSEDAELSLNRIEAAESTMHQFLTHWTAEDIGALLKKSKITN
jgi:hypothetical protein